MTETSLYNYSELDWTKFVLSYEFLNFTQPENSWSGNGLHRVWLSLYSIALRLLYITLSNYHCV